MSRNVFNSPELLASSAEYDREVKQTEKPETKKDGGDHSIR